MKLTKIVATVGPACAQEAALTTMIQRGVNVFRFNFKHNDPVWHAQYIRLVKKLANQLNIRVSTLIDLQGPSIRTNLPSEKVDFVAGEIIPFGEVVFKKNVKGISISHPHIIPHLKHDEEIHFADGTITFLVKKKGAEFFLEAQIDGTLQNKKNVNIPTSDFLLPVLMERDYAGLKLAKAEHVDFIALSFVRSVQDIIDVQAEMDKQSFAARIVSKIETLKSIDVLDEIINHTDAVMVARGDLGVEIPVHTVPYYQKLIIRKCVEKGVPVITATQMIESMIQSSLPTRAEISDIANATYDLTDAVMLSGETAFGAYPLEAVSVMAQTLEYNEVCFTEDVRMTHSLEVETDESHVVEMAYNLYLTVMKNHLEKMAGFIVFTQSGQTARLLSRYRPTIPIYAFCPTELVARTLTINFGVYPSVHHEISPHSLVTKEDIDKTLATLQQEKRMKAGDKVIVIHGNYWSKEGGTNTVKLITM